ncbi:YdeI/OmpD-associated family protein [Micromonospora sp. FIMYZ51]|uniref:YdeI/OmpD-associated family protein n=1 Tax=Micromonospora sp. FIMYZ51 TaxID=3051832 RepID=UPI00311F1B91
MSETFHGTLVCEQVGAWTYVTVPDEVAARLGDRARVPVTGHVEDASFTGSMMTGPNGVRYIVVNKAVREAAGVAAGDTVRVTLAPDAATRTVEVPDDLAAALADAPAAGEFFETLSYSRTKEYVSWITGAKRPETRARRVAQAVELLAAGRVLKG